MSLSKSFEFHAAVRGYHVYRNIWAPQVNENLNCYHEEGNLFDIFAIEICRTTDNEVVGHLPREISRPTKYLLDRRATMTVTFTSDRYRRSPLYQGGLEIPCLIKVTVVGTKTGQSLIQLYSEMVNKLYCEPEEDLSVGSFLEVEESSMNLQPKKRKIVEKKTTVVPKSKNIKTI